MINFGYLQRLDKFLVIVGIVFLFFGILVHFFKPGLIGICNAYPIGISCCNLKIYCDILTIPLLLTGIILCLGPLFKNSVVKIYDRVSTKVNNLFFLLIITVFIILGVISYIVFNNFPYSMDEYNYFYQANIFAKGKLYIETTESFRPFKELYMILHKNKLFSKYPPGFPLILSIGILLNISGLVNPLLAVLTLAFVYFFISSFLDKKYALASTIIMATTPYFLAYSASYYSHPTALFITVILLFFLRKYELTSNVVYLWLLGFFSGYGFLTRPLDAFCIIVPVYSFLSYMLYKKKNIKKLLYPTVIFAMLFVCFLTYNYILSGKVSIATYPIITGEFKVVDPHAHGALDNLKRIFLNYFSNGFKFLPLLFGKYFFLQCGFLVPALGIFGIVIFKSRWKWVFAGNILLLILLYNFHGGLAWPQYGARYYYSGFASLVILSIFGLRSLAQLVKRYFYWSYLVLFILCSNLALSAICFNEYYYRFKTKLAIIEDIRSRCPEKSIIFLDIPVGEKIYSSNSKDCVRRVSYLNLGSERRNMFMNEARLIGYFKGKRYNIDEIRSNFPEHSICYYDYGILKDFKFDGY